MHGYHLPCKWFFYTFFLSPLSTSDSPHFIFLISFLTSLSSINILSFHQTLSFHQINFLADQCYRPKPHCRFVGFFFSPSPICWLLVIFLLWWAISVGLFFRLCGFRLVTGVDLMWVPIVPMVAMWFFGLFQVCERWPCVGCVGFVREMTLLKK